MPHAHEDIITLALELSRILRRRMAKRVAAKSGTNMMRSYALAFIRESGNMTMTDFAKTMRVSASTATAFVDRLVKAGWVKRVADPVNRKLVHLHITRSGERMLLKSTQEKRLLLAELLTLLPAADRKHLERILATLLRRLNDA
jgi:DNA-binding MarR family transcriptional regulator